MTSRIVYERSYFGDLDGRPLEDGTVYIGVADMDPETDPIDCFWDSALTVPAAQPLAVTAGYIVNDGARAAVYVAEAHYSLRARNRANVQVDYVARAGEDAASGTGSGGYRVHLNYIGTPGDNGWMGGHYFVDSVTFPIDFGESCGGKVKTNPGATYVISIKKNGFEIGTITISTGGAFTFATTGHLEQVFDSGDQLDFYGPPTAGTAANFTATLGGEMA